MRGNETLDEPSPEPLLRRALVIMRGHALTQNIHRRECELGIDASAHRRIETAFAELALTISPGNGTGIRFTAAGYT
jgi:hypothetical protein